jgi:phosphatidylinositol glycan class H protein
MTRTGQDPLLATHPQYTVVHGPGFFQYKIQNWLPARDSSSFASGCLWSLGVWPVIVSLLWFKVNRETSILIGVLAISWLYKQCTQVLSESVIVFPPHGIQLETERGLRGLPLSTSRFFIPTVELQDFLINEGLTGWNVRYYLVAVQRSSAADIKLHVAFENILPHFPILREVYHDIHRLLFVPSERDKFLRNTAS